LDAGRIEDIPQVTEEENHILVEEFTEDEVRKVVFQMEHALLQIGTVAMRTHLTVPMDLSWPVAIVTMGRSSDGRP
jgi:hypothetical protein